MPRLDHSGLASCGTCTAAARGCSNSPGDTFSRGRLSYSRHGLPGQWVVLFLAGITACAGAPAVYAADPWADAVLSYNPGVGADPGYSSNSAVTLGSPERFTGETDFGGAFQGVVSIFNPTFGTDEILSIGEGGSLVVQFNEPIVNDPGHLYGVDLIVFGNSFFAADFSNFPDVTQLTSASLFDSDSALIEVSADGVNWFAVSAAADQLFPTQGYLDSGAFDGVPGLAPTDFLKPVDPALTAADFNGLTYAQSVALYDGSGGGTPIDIGQTPLGSASFVRISVLDDGNPGTTLNAEIDAFAAVPEPATALLLAAACLTGGMSTRRRR